MKANASLTPAKLNLFLYVLKKRDDGYHDILTLMQKVSLYDKVELSIEDGEGITIHTNNGTIPVNEENTAYIAAELFFKHKGIKQRHVDITIEKHIPVQAGMGGASSDAACVLKLLNRLLPSYTEQELFELSKHIGSDVPFFMVDGNALASGRGEILKKVEIKDPMYYVVVKPDFGVSTRWAYSRIKTLTKSEQAFMCDLALYTKDDIIRCLQNDLEAVVEMHTPEIKTIKEKLLQSGAKAAAMTGSGSCIFGIFYEEQEAEKTFIKFSNEYTTVYKLRGI
ncbi:MAG: 4-(cytidine 5'-diphospho)-2-C-methyl-D-erythritol kinase [bacterium]